jgi:hypothetical protein
MPNRVGRPTHPEKYRVLDYITKNPKVSYRRVAVLFGVGKDTIKDWASAAGIKRGKGANHELLIITHKKRKILRLEKELAAARIEVEHLEALFAGEVTQ